MAECPMPMIWLTESAHELFADEMPPPGSTRIKMAEEHKDRDETGINIRNTPGFPRVQGFGNADSGYGLQDSFHTVSPIAPAIP